MTPSLSNNSQYGAGMLQAEAARQNAMTQLVAQTPPERVNIDYNRLNTLGKDYGLLNALQSKDLEREVDPHLASIRAAQAADIDKAYADSQSGNVPVAIKNAMLKAGLSEGLSSTGNVKSGSAGLSSLGNLYGTKLLEYQNMMRQLAGQYLGANPLQQAGLDAGSAMNLNVTNDQDNANLTNSWKQQLLQAQANSNSTLSNMGGQLFSGAINEGNSNTQAKNASSGAKMALAGAGVAAGATLGAAAIF